MLERHAGESLIMRTINTIGHGWQGLIAWIDKDANRLPNMIEFNKFKYLFIIFKMKKKNKSKATL